MHPILGGPTLAFALLLVQSFNVCARCQSGDFEESAAHFQQETTARARSIARTREQAPTPKPCYGHAVGGRRFASKAATGISQWTSISGRSASG